ncbi:MAG: hypothetical protein C4575_07155 [Desulforudis sp.]|nr:MAG: hypothetical protein C4575_07155 [Desulforudis sp.]
MLKRILCVIFVTALFAGLSLSPAHAGLLEDLLAAGNLPAERTIRVGGEFITVKARLDRSNQLVYGLPTQVPGNDWKSTKTCWQSDNGVNVGRPNQEPRYLGYTGQGDLFSSEWFPIDATHHVPPSDRKMIEEPWDQDLTDTENLPISDYTWEVIMAALAEYHKLLGFADPEFPGLKAFYHNPAFAGGKFNKETLNRYFKVLAEPRPGVAGAVRHWHNRSDLGGIFYDTIAIQWHVLPDFKVVDFPVYHGEIVPVYLDPGTELAKPGETYRGTLRIVGGVHESILTDPAARDFFGAVEVKNLTLSEQYDVPAGIAVDGKLIRPVEFRRAGFDGEALNVFMVRIGQGETVVEFDWSLPEGYSKSEITLDAEVNSTGNILLPDRFNRYRDRSEWYLLNNYTKVVVPTSIVLPDFSVELIPDRFEAQAGQALTGTVRYKLNDDHPQAETAWLRLHHLAGSEHVINLQPVDPADAPNAQGHVVFQPGDVKEYRYSFTVQANSQKVIARINPISVSHDKDWSNNRAEALIGQPCTDVRIAMSRSPDGVRYTGDTTKVAAVVTRANDGPAGSIPVRVRITGPGLNYDQTINLARGESRTINQVVTLNDPGSHAYQGSAWPVGIEDCVPANNTRSVTIPVQAPVQYDAGDSKLSHEIRGSEGKVFVNLISTVATPTRTPAFTDISIGGEQGDSWGVHDLDIMLNQHFRSERWEIATPVNIWLCSMTKGLRLIEDVRLPWWRGDRWIPPPILHVYGGDLASRMRLGQPKAFYYYDPKTGNSQITLSAGAFDSPDVFAATLAHELGHWIWFAVLTDEERDHYRKLTGLKDERAIWERFAEGAREFIFQAPHGAGDEPVVEEYRFNWADAGYFKKLAVELGIKTANQGKTVACVH